MLFQSVHKDYVAPKLTEKSNVYSSNSPKQNEFDQCILEMYSEGLPFNFVERKSFKKMVKILNSRIRVKSRQAYKRKLNLDVEKHVSTLCMPACIWKS